MCRSENPVESGGVSAPRRQECCEATAPGHAVGGDDGPQDIASEALEPAAVGGVGVERKSIDDGGAAGRSSSSC